MITSLNLSSINMCFHSKHVTVRNSGCSFAYIILSSIYHLAQPLLLSKFIALVGEEHQQGQAVNMEITIREIMNISILNFLSLKFATSATPAVDFEGRRS